MQPSITFKTNVTQNVTQFKNGALDWSRTSDLPLRRRLLYPAELQGLSGYCLGMGF